VAQVQGLQDHLFQCLAVGAAGYFFNDVSQQGITGIAIAEFGAGLKIKNMEALANGVPLVTTTHGARGLEDIQQKGFLLADDPGDFTQAITSLIESKALRQQLGEYAHDYIKDNFSPETCFRPLMDVI